MWSVVRVAVMLVLSREGGGDTTVPEVICGVW